MLPSPNDYSSWQSFASALITALGVGSEDVVAGSATTAGTVVSGGGGSSGSGDVPSGYSAVLWDPTGSKLILTDSFWSVPAVPPVAAIDTINLALASVKTSNLGDGAVTSAKILDAAIGSADIANAAIISALIGDAQIVTAKIADLAVNQAKIANLAVGSAQIQDAAVGNAKIANLAVGTAQIIDLNVTTAKIANLAVGAAQIADATITSAKIGLAQITAALIANLAVGTAAIADSAITNAKIADATITSAKIASLVIDKVTAGTLDAIIDMGTGLIRFAIGGFKLVLGKGFGSSAQFIMWFGPSMAESSMTEGTATFYIKTDGSAYFGGTLSAGLLKNGAVATTHSHNDTSETGSFGSNGNPRTYIAAIDYTYTGTVNSGGSWSGTPSYVLFIEKFNGSSWITLTSATITGSNDPGPYGTGDTTHFRISGSLTYTDSSGGTTVQNLRSRVASFVSSTFSGSFTTASENQRLSIQSTEG